MVSDLWLYGWLKRTWDSIPSVDYMVEFLREAVWFDEQQVRRVCELYIKEFTQKGK